MDINLPGIYVHRIVPATVEKQIEVITTSPSPTAPGTPEAPSAASQLTGDKLVARLKREKIAKRCAKELKDGYYANLGVGESSQLCFHRNVLIWSTRNPHTLRQLPQARDSGLAPE